jgi:nicotinamide-nucleotide amidase
LTGVGTTPTSRVIKVLRARGASVACAESLTGGLVIAALTAVPGASAVVRGGVVAYSADVKRDVLQVPAVTLESSGAVSEQAAVAMARGVRQLLGADWGVATTGVAGPEASEGKPVGTVHVAVSGIRADGEEVRRARALSLHGSREEIRGATVEQAVDLLAEVIARP